MDSLLAFIPIDRRHALAADKTLPDRTTGAALFADLSGFTALTAALAHELGIQRGAEEVLNQLNPVYKALIGELHGYGGSVMGFAGDSITCWLDGDEGGRAVACALAMQRAMEPFATVYTPAGTPINLFIKVAVAIGTARRFVVGDPAIQLIDIIAGKTVDHVARAEKLAAKGETLITEQVAKLLGEAVEVAEWRESADGERFAVIRRLRTSPPPNPDIIAIPPLPADALPEEVVKQWVLPPVFERLKAGARFLAELRPSVPLFLKFEGIDYDDDDEAGPKLDAFTRWVQSVVQRHDGYMIQLTMGDKGSFLYASFGAPVAHDDDDERAVAAALELRSPPGNLAFIKDIQIGISRGRSWAGECGAPIRHTYGVMGNEVNMAARLMSKAEPGQILVRRRVAEATAHTYQYEQLGLMTVKGGTEPIAVSELLGKHTAQSLQASQFTHPLIGRDMELAQMERLLDNVLARRGQVLGLQGMAGIGKSHLATTFSQRAIANGFQIAAGTCQRSTQETAYYPWQQLLRQVLGLTTLPVADQTAEAFAQEQVATVTRTLLQLNPGWQVRLPLLGDILGLPMPDNPTTAAFEPRRRQETLFSLVIEILAAWTRSQPLLLVIENARWMDEASRLLTEALARAVGQLPIMVMLTYRPVLESSEDSLATIERLPYFQAVTVRELTPRDISQLLENLLSSKVSFVAQAVIQARAQGSPFFTSELVDTLRESGQLVLSDGEWMLSDSMIAALHATNSLVQEAGVWTLSRTADLSAVNLGIPDSVHGIVLSRIDRLPESHKPTLKVASVVGYTFDLDVLTQAHPARLDDQLLRTQAQALEERDFIFRDWLAQVSAEAYTFRQQTTQEVVYETLLFTQRRVLHCSLAEILERKQPEATTQIAYHAYLGEDWPRALRYQLLAGLQAKQLFANLQSIDHFQKALHSAAHLSKEETALQRQEIHLSLGELLLTSGQYEPAADHLRRALAIAEEQSDVHGQGRACRWIARSHEMRAQYQQALEWIDRGLSALGNQVTPEALEMRLISGLIHSRLGNYKTAREQALASLLASDELGDLAISARAHNLLGIIDRLRGRLSRGIDHFHQALTMYREVENLHGQAQAQNQLATAHFDLGNWTEADRYYRQAGQIFSQMGDAYGRLLVDNNLGGIALNQGRLDEALNFYSRALAAQQRVGGSLWVMGALHLNLGATQIKREELTAAFEHLNISQDYFEQAKVRDLLPEMHRRLAEAYLREGDLEQARDEVEKSVSLALELSMPADEGQALLVLGEIATAQEEYDEAQFTLEQALDTLREVSDEYGLACGQLSLARLYDLRGEPDAAQAELANCIPVFERLGATLDLAAARELQDQQVSSGPTELGQLAVR